MTDRITDWAMSRKREPAEELTTSKQNILKTIFDTVNHKRCPQFSHILLTFVHHP